MPHLNAFIMLTLDGCYADPNNDMSAFHKSPDDAEWNSFVAGNATGGGTLIFGRITYEMMAGFWPTPMAAKAMPAVAEGMNAAKKILVSRTITQPAWQNTAVLDGELVAGVRSLKQQPGPPITLLGSGSIVAQLLPHRLIDVLQIVINPIILGGGKKLFDGVNATLPLKLTKSRTFKNGSVVLWYEN